MTRSLRSWATAALLLSGCGQPPTPSAPPAPPVASAAPTAEKPLERAATPPPAPGAGLCSVDGLPSAWVGPQDATWGSPDAPVSLVLFEDFDHVYGRRMSKTLASLMSQYGPDKLRVVWKNYPLDFHPHAREAAVVGQAVLAQKGQDAFWRYHDTLFSIGSLETRDPPEHLSVQDIRSAARAAGLDEAAVTGALADHGLQDKIDADLALAKALGVSGAPHSFINGLEMNGAQELDKFSALVDRELEGAQAGKPSAGRACEKTKATLASRPAASDKPKPPPDTSVWKVPVGSSPARGGPRALVTIVEFGGYQDPYSRKVEKTLSRLREIYQDKIRIVWKDNPLAFQTMSEPAAEVAREVLAKKGAEAFWRAHDELLTVALDEASIEQVGRSAGVDAKAVMARKPHDRAITADVTLADDLQASGTPHFFINGRRLVGAQPVEVFQRLIDDEMTKAEALVQKGQKPETLYDTLMASAKPPEPFDRITLPPSPPDAPSRGAAGAKVVIEEFAGFQDPFSVKVEDTLKTLLSTYQGKVRLVWRNRLMPFHREAQIAAEAAAEALAQKGPDGFWKMHDLLLSKQAEPDGLKQPALEAYAAQLGLDVAKFRDALSSHRHAAEVERDVKYAEAAKISATPTFAINGYLVSGAQPLRRFRRVIDRALSEPSPRKK